MFDCHFCGKRDLKAQPPNDHSSVYLFFYIIVTLYSQVYSRERVSLTITDPALSSDFRSLGRKLGGGNVGNVGTASLTKGRAGRPTPKLGSIIL